MEIKLESIDIADEVSLESSAEANFGFAIAVRSSTGY